MTYEGIVYRPPSEARSLIVQATIGCSHNQCTYCSMYKEKAFQVRELDAIEADLAEARQIHKHVKRIFLADGDAFAMPMNQLETVLKRIKDVFPECERVGMYASPGSIVSKSVSDLRKLMGLGVGILYLGIESGSDRVLTRMQKGATAEIMMEAGRKVKAAGMKLSVMVISGLGGLEFSDEHALESARVINAINPDYLSLLTLMVEPETPLFNEVLTGRFQILSVDEVMAETHALIQHLELENCLLRTNHASNYLAIGGRLPESKAELLQVITDAMARKSPYRIETIRGL